MAKEINAEGNHPAKARENHAAQKAMIGSLAEQGINGVNAMVKFRSFSFSTVRALMTPGTEQPIPTMKGMIDLPISRIS
jgi:hypothetical protein